MLKKHLLALGISFLCVSEARAMQCIAKRLNSPVYKAYKRMAVIAYPITLDLFREVEAVGLKKCMRAYKTEPCKNTLCCRDAFNSCHTIEAQKKNYKKKVAFVKKINKTEGKLSFLQKVRYAYNELSRIEKLAIGDVEEDELRGLISHQKKCLRNQLKVIQDESGELAFINDKDQFIVDKEYAESLECKSAYKKEKCHNRACCKDVFCIYSLGEIMGWRDLDRGDPDLYQIIRSIYNQKRETLLKHVDAIGQVSFLLKIKKDYEILCAREKKLVDVKKDVLSEELLKKIIHQKLCLQGQIFVLYEECPDVKTYRDGIDERGGIRPTVYFPRDEAPFGTDQYVEKAIMSLLKKIDNNRATKE